MAHERDDNKYDGQEDGEYHFSDDQGGYEVEPEITPAKPAPKTASPVASIPLKDRLNQYRKPLIGVGVFMLLIFLVYKISAPSSTAIPNTDFAQNAGTIPVQKPMMKQLPKPIKVAQAPAQSAAEFQPLPQAPAMSMGSPTSAAPTTAAMQPPATTAAQGMPESATISAPPPPLPETVATVIAPAPKVAPAETYYNPAQPNSNLSPAEKLAALEQESAKLTAQYAQKLAEQQAQNAALQNQVQDLTQRLASMETTLAHLGHLIQDLKPGRGGSGSMAAGPLEPNAPVALAPSGEPKLTYSVQAIIPGRAWLKSDNGETVTVAEGDILKNYGRIMKIDPYDGVVQIDTGSHIMNLAYGVSTD
ncbi:MAG: hypothetical protein V4501_06785 [Pseudomonadota bacterium]